MKQRARITLEVIDEVPLHGGGFAARNAEIEAHDAAAIAEELTRDNQRLESLLPGYHWHSVVAARGWEQPTLDGRNGGEDPSAWLHDRARAEERKPPGPATPRSTSRPI